ncbi:hypothetical protein HGRIS_012896 [Hohenbuehelia grisea]|uniref:Uncharacterized protein n=1 Tax=Hohenbuehelia grisea TaxID=104357 RepID=A0ABR3ITW7_9AGAR
MPSPSFNFSIALVVLCASTFVQAYRPAHPPYLSLKHRSLLIARADAPPACIGKVGLNSTDGVNGTSSDGFDLGGINATSAGTATASSIIPSATDVALNGTDSTALNGTDTGTLNGTDTTSLNGTDPTANTTTTPVNGTVSDTLPGTPFGDNSTSVDDSSTANGVSSSLNKRIAQSDLPELALKWQELCLLSGGDIFTLDSEDSPCVRLGGFDGITALLADADPCAQQDNADAMIDFAKSRGIRNKAALIKFAVAYRKHPRSAVNMLGVVPSTPYCQKAPKHSELSGVVNGQLDGVDPSVFGGPNSDMVPFGAAGTCPFGETADVSTCSCLPASSTDVAPGLNSTSPVDSTTNTTLPDISANSTDVGTSAPPSVALNGPDAAPVNASLPINGTDATPVATSLPLNGTDATPANASVPVNGTDAAPVAASIPLNGTDTAPSDASLNAPSASGDDTDSASAPS